MCKVWREVLYSPPYWREVRPVLHCRELRAWDSCQLETKKSFYLSLQLRGCDSITLLHANDADVFDFIQHYPQANRLNIETHRKLEKIYFG